MKSSLSIQEKLKDLRVERGLTLDELAEQTGLSKSALSSYETNDFKDITHTSIVTLAKFYGVSADYLLGLTENKNHPNTDLAELHLSDDMIALLKSGQINTRLLCEMAVHPNFALLLTDAEIYIDGIATQQIKSMNDWLDIARTQILKQYGPDENDLCIRLMNTAQLNEETYFSDVAHDDIDAILHDLRQAHKADFESMPDNSTAQTITKSFQRATSLSGNRLEQQAFFFSEQLGIDPTKLSQEELQGFAKLLRKSRTLYPLPMKGLRHGRHWQQKKKK